MCQRHVWRNCVPCLLRRMTEVAVYISDHHLNFLRCPERKQSPCRCLMVSCTRLIFRTGKNDGPMRVSPALRIASWMFTKHLSIPTWLGDKVENRIVKNELKDTTALGVHYDVSARTSWVHVMFKFFLLKTLYGIDCFFEHVCHFFKSFLPSYAFKKLLNLRGPQNPSTSTCISCQLPTNQRNLFSHQCG